MRINHPVEELKDWQLAYIAGIIDGEGAVYLTSKGSYLQGRVSVAVTNIECINVLYNTTKMGRLYQEKRQGRKVLYKWTVFKRLEIYLLLKSIYSYLVIKKKQADIMLEFIERRIQGTSTNAYDFQLYENLRDSNK